MTLLTTGRDARLDRLPTLLSPKSIALVGASDRSQWTTMVFDSLNGYGFAGKLHPVNRRGAAVRGIPATTSCQDIGEPVDLAALMLPESAVLDGLRDVAAAGIENVIVLASGMGEGGDSAAHERERELIELVDELGLLMLGPNSLGMMNALDRTGAWFAPPPEVVLPGNFAIVSQSGALAHAVTRFAASQHLGLSHVVATGNEAMVDTIDVAGALLEDERVRAVAIFAEALRRPERVLATARRALELGKAIVMLKAGATELSAQLAVSHTGALVGDDGVIDAALKAAGVIRVGSIEELVITAGLIAHTGALEEGGLGVISISGGSCDIVADRAEELGIPLPALREEAREKLRSSTFSGHNPLDVTGLVLGDSNLVNEAMSAMADDPGIALIAYVQILCDLNFQPPGEPYWKALGPALGAQSRPAILVDQTLQTLEPEIAELLAGIGVPYVVGGMDAAMVAIGHAMWWSGRVRAAAEAPPTSAAVASVEVVADGAWSETQALELLGDHGVPVVPWRAAATREEAVAAAEAIGYPVVVKVASAEIAHKMDIGGVALDLGDATAVGEAFDRVVAAGQGTGATVDGVTVAKMRGGGVELIAGIVRDEQWGLVLALGLGGIFVNVLEDKSLRVLPVDCSDVRGMLSELRGAALLEGARGTRQADLDAIADAVVALAQLALGLGDRLASLEINPLRVDGDQVEALDALCTWREEA